MKLRSQILIQNWEDGRTTLQFTRGDDARAEKMQTTCRTDSMTMLMSQIVDRIWQSAFRESQAFRSPGLSDPDPVPTPVRLAEEVSPDFRIQTDLGEMTIREAMGIGDVDGIDTP